MAKKKQAKASEVGGKIVARDDSLAQALALVDAAGNVPELRTAIHNALVLICARSDSNGNGG